MFARRGRLRNFDLLLPSHGRRGKTRFAYPTGMVAFEDDYVDTPDYPKIDPELRLMSDKRKERLAKRLNWQDKVREGPSVEEKNMELNMIRKYGWVCQVLQENYFEYGSQPYYRHITRTHLASRNTLPEVYSSPDIVEKVKYFKEKVKVPLIDALKFETEAVTSNHAIDGLGKGGIHPEVTNSMVSQVNRVLLSVLGNEVAHLTTCRIDNKPKIDAFWLVGGMEPSIKERKLRDRVKMYFETNKKKMSYEFYDDPVERNIQYFGSPLLQIRYEDPIANFVETDSSLVCKGEDVTDRFSYDHKLFNIRTEYKFASNIPGHWAGDLHRCSHIGIHPMNHLMNVIRHNNPLWTPEDENSIQSQAILASFSRLFSQAFYFGFDQFSDLNYPFSTQTIITDGLRWSFFAYQLNTIKFDRLNICKNNKQNICWSMGTEDIFEKGSKDKLNDVVLENLLKFYLNPPVPLSTPKSEVTPYLKRTLNDLEDEKLRNNLHLNFRDMVCQKPDRGDGYRLLQFPEIYHWERIYKIKFKTRPLDARRKHYELPWGFKGSHPYSEPYKIKDKNKIGKGLRFMMEDVEIRKEKERIEAAKLKEKSKYAQND